MDNDQRKVRGLDLDDRIRHYKKVAEEERREDLKRHDNKISRANRATPKP